MSKKVVILNGSPRQTGNTSALKKLKYMLCGVNMDGCYTTKSPFYKAGPYEATLFSCVHIRDRKCRTLGIVGSHSGRNKQRQGVRILQKELQDAGILHGGIHFTAAPL